MVFITCGVASLCQIITAKDGTTFCDRTGPAKRNRTLTIFHSFSHSPTYGKQGSELTGLSKTERQISVRPVPPKVIPNIPVERNRNGLFHISDRNFRNLWHNGKHLRSSSVGALWHGKWDDGKSFPLFFYFYQLGRYYRKDILSHGSWKQGKRKCRDSVTFS